MGRQVAWIRLAGRLLSANRRVKEEVGGRRIGRIELDLAIALAGLLGRIVRRLCVRGSAVLSSPSEAGLDEAGILKHREEDLPRHGPSDSVGPGRLVGRRLFALQAHVAGLKPATGT